MGRMASSFPHLWETLAPIGREAGGYQRFSWTATDAAARRWFLEQAEQRDMPAAPDGNGNLWAWWGDPSDGAVVTGSHLDSVPDGGGFDGALGIVSAFAAIDDLRRLGLKPRKPIAVACFTEEEGSRFGVACLGSRLMAGTIEPAAAARLEDANGKTLAEAMWESGHDPEELGPTQGRVELIGAFVELHCEQGKALAPKGLPIGLGTEIISHGRWRFVFEGEANHAGTTSIEDRRDPILPMALMADAARREAAAMGALATVGRFRVVPNATNAVPSRVEAWLDCRAHSQRLVEQVVRSVEAVAIEASRRHNVDVKLEQESFTPAVKFSDTLRERVRGVLAAEGIASMPLATGAGHDAGVLAARVPTAMIFVRNPTGVSHSPAEHIEPADCLVGVRALAAVLAELAEG